MTTGSAVAALFALLGLGLWMVPAMIAYSRNHPKRKAILITDLLLSWTVVGWFFALGWALLAVEESGTGEQTQRSKAKASAA